MPGLVSGFTLIELMVSIGLFAIVMTMVSGAYLMIINVSQQAEALSTAVDGVSYALESMTRTIRTGSGYVCGLIAGEDCAYPSSGNTFTLSDQTGATVVFSRQQIPGSTKYGIYQGNSLLTDPAINITALTFYLVGSKPYGNGGDTTPPHVTILVSGTMTTEKQSFPFTIETGATMRGIDL